MALRVESSRPRHRSEMLTKAVEDVLLHRKVQLGREGDEEKSLA